MISYNFIEYFIEAFILETPLELICFAGDNWLVGDNIPRKC